MSLLIPFAEQLHLVDSGMNGEFEISVVIPTWNNLPYLRHCVNALIKNSKCKIQIIIIINEGKDGTLDWAENQADIDYVYSAENLGICLGLNAARPLIKAPFLIYFNDDMYALPGWDISLLDAIKSIGHHQFMLSATMIEPVDTGNKCVIVQDYGTDLETFREAELLQDYTRFQKSDWQGSTWPPILLPLQLWDLIGGMSIEFHPGMYSDPDLTMKAYQAGVRIFLGVGNARVYHFGSKSTQKSKKNPGRKMFLMKWGITAGKFMEKIIGRGEHYKGALPIHPSITSGSLEKIKKIWEIIK